MEADLDLGDKLHSSGKELSGDQLIIEQYTSRQPISYNNILYSSSTNDMKSKSTIDPVLHRPTTPGQLRQSVAAHTVDTLAKSLATGTMYRSQSDGFDNTLFPNSTKKSSLSSNEQIKQINDDRTRSNSSESIHSSTSSIADLTNKNNEIEES
jgi:hypothetical protein